MFSSVDFPDPDGPSSARTSPGATVMSTPFRTGGSSAAWLYIFVSPCASTTGADASSEADAGPAVFAVRDEADHDRIAGLEPLRVPRLDLRVRPIRDPRRHGDGH